MDKETEDHLDDMMVTINDKFERLINGQRTLERDNTNIRTLALGLVEQGRRIERRVNELRDDIELMVKVEPMGRLGNFETRIERQIMDLSERVAALEKPTP